MKRFLTHHCPVLCAVFRRGDAVQAAEGLEEAAVIRKAALGAGVQNGYPLSSALRQCCIRR